MNKTSTAAAQAHPSRRDIDPDLLPRRPRLAGRKRRDEQTYDERGGMRIAIKRTLYAQYGCPLPDDDAGRESFALLCHAAFFGFDPDEIEQRTIRTAALWADWFSPSDIDALIDAVARRERPMTPQYIGRKLNLTKELRQRVEAWPIWPVGYSNADWKRDTAERDRQRAARNRAAKRGTTKTAKCMDFLRNVFVAAAGQPVPAASIMRMAVSLDLEKAGAKCFGTSMRQAYAALGVEQRKMGLRRGWAWRLPQAEKTSETPDFSGGDLSERPETPDFLEAVRPERPETPGFLEAVRPDAKTPGFLEAVIFRSDIKREPNGRTVLDEGEPAREGAASGEGRSLGDAPCLAQRGTSHALPDQDEDEPRSAPRLPPVGPATATLPSIGRGFGRIAIDQPWAQPLRAFATASRQERDRGWLVIIGQGDGLALQAARHRWGGVPVINQHGGEA
jgi:hypothetical protein